jgi:ParB/RepB/Spo0J family partition protein
LVTPKLELPSDFARHIAETLGVTAKAVSELFEEIEEDKQGFFVAKLKPKHWLDKGQFRMMCALVRDLGGESYLQGAKAWKVPGPYAKKPQAPETSKLAPESSKTSTESSTTSTPSTLGPQYARSIPVQLKYDKSKPPESGLLPIKLGYCEKFAIQFILSPKFTFRMNIENDIQELIEQIATTRAGDEFCIIVEPLVCRPASTPGYIEVGAGERRLLAARKMGLGVVPVIIKNFTDEEFDRIRMMENLARKDLTDYEVARALKYLMEVYPNVYPTQAIVAEVFGKTKGWVSQRLAMLELEKVYPGKLQTGKITERQAREILAAPTEKQEEILDKINETGVVPSARDLHEAVQPAELPSEQGTDSEAAYKEVGNEIPEEEPVGFEPTTPAGLPGPEPAALKAVQIGEFDCTECGRHFFVDHLPDGDHKLREVKEMTK